MRPDVLVRPPAPATRVRPLTAALGRLETALRCAVATAAVRRPGVRPLGSRSARRTLGGVFLDVLCCHCLLNAPQPAAAACLVPLLLRQSAEELGLYFGPHVPADPGGHTAGGREQLRALHRELALAPSEGGPDRLDGDRLGAALAGLRSVTGREPGTAWLRSAAGVFLEELASIRGEGFERARPAVVVRRAPQRAVAERRALLAAAAVCADVWLVARAQEPSAFLADPAWLTGVLLRTSARLGAAPVRATAPEVAGAATAEVLERCAQGRRFDPHGTPL
ncbi:hypothetical protein [Streptomyces sp. NPDC002078]